MSKKIAIITGASSGLGREFVRLLDADSAGESTGEFHPDELWIIARRKERLEELAAGLRTDTVVLPLDLTDKTSVTQLQEKLSAEQPDVRVLINAAGSGKIAASEALTLEQVDTMIDLNCRAAVDVTQACLPYMSSGAKIMEVCSTAAFQPIPYLNVYAASKAFLYRYSRALRFELRPRDITVTAVCPYWITGSRIRNSFLRQGRPVPQTQQGPMHTVRSARSRSLPPAKPLRKKRSWTRDSAFPFQRPASSAPCTARRQSSFRATF